MKGSIQFGGPLTPSDRGFAIQSGFHLHWDTSKSRHSAQRNRSGFFLAIGLRRLRTSAQSQAVERRGSLNSTDSDAGILRHVTFEQLTRSSRCSTCESPQLRSLSRISNGRDDVVTLSEKLSNKFETDTSTSSYHNPR